MERSRSVHSGIDIASSAEDTSETLTRQVEEYSWFAGLFRRNRSLPGNSLELTLHSQLFQGIKFAFKTNEDNADIDLRLMYQDFLHDTVNYSFKLRS
jgi:hypothetical protein